MLAQQAKGKSGYSVATLTRKTTILKHFLQYLYKEKYITAPLHEGFKAISVRKDDRPNRDVGSIDMVQVLDAFVKTENIYAFSVIQLLVTTGIRNEELCKLCVEDVYTAVNGSSYMKIVGKGNKLRDVPLHPSVKESIHYYRQARGVPSIANAAKGSPFLPTSKGKALSPSYLVQWLDKQFETIRDVLPCDFKRLTPHYFRHAFAIISHENGANIYDIMRSLGHENIETTMIYLAKVFEQEKHTSFNWTNNMSKYL